VSPILHAFLGFLPAWSVPELTVGAAGYGPASQAAASSPAILVPYVLYFLLVSFVVALVTSAIRMRNPRKISHEANRFFLTIVVGIFLFSALVWLLEWLLIRP
jgi:hypothetical protein